MRMHINAAARPRSSVAAMSVQSRLLTAGSPPLEAPRPSRDARADALTASPGQLATPPSLGFRRRHGEVAIPRNHVARTGRPTVAASTCRQPCRCRAGCGHFTSTTSGRCVRRRGRHVAITATSLCIRRRARLRGSDHPTVQRSGMVEASRSPNTSTARAAVSRLRSQLTVIGSSHPARRPRQSDLAIIGGAGGQERRSRSGGTGCAWSLS